MLVPEPETIQHAWTSLADSFAVLVAMSETPDTESAELLKQCRIVASSLEYAYRLQQVDDGRGPGEYETLAAYIAQCQAVQLPVSSRVPSLLYDIERLCAAYFMAGGGWEALLSRISHVAIVPEE